jgi:hypothetical protein
MKLSLLVGIGSGVVAMLGCNSIHLKADVFQNQPLWRSAALGYNPQEESGKQPLVAAATPSKKPPSPRTIKRSEAPGLYSLVAQVLGPNDPSLEDDNPPVCAFRNSAEGSTYKLAVASEPDPLPASVAALPAMKAVVSSLQAAYLCKDVPDMKLCPCDFRNLAEEAFKSSVSSYQDVHNANSQRLKKLALFSVTFSKVLQITWQSLATSYFTAYYQGNFVDRTGGTLSKPTIGATISNDTITSALTVFLEATYDYALLQCNQPGSKTQLRDPIVFDPGAKDPKQLYQTKDGAVPTLVKVIEEALHQSDPDNFPAFDSSTPPKLVDGIIEPLNTDETKVGITKEKLDTIRLLSGLAADASGACSDLITRTFGGIHIGIVLLGGKISIGDNDTLAKIVQTTADLVAKRTTEAAVANFLYDRTKPKQLALTSLAAGSKPAIPEKPDVADLLGYTEPIEPSGGDNRTSPAQ